MSRRLSNRDDCLDAERLHTKAPSGYLAWHEWAGEMAKTHRQKRCPTCGLWAIWERREAVATTEREKP